MSDKRFISLVIAGSFVLIVGAYLLVSKSSPQPSQSSQSVRVASYKTSDAEKPQAEVKETKADFGKIKLSDEKMQDFTIKNVGKGPLQLSNIKSSCHCTVGQVIYEGQKSEEFGMHEASDYLAEIAPGKQAIIRVTYRPAQMPVSGFVEREVYVTTNDPANKQLVFKVTANVQ